VDGGNVDSFGSKKHHLARLIKSELGLWCLMPLSVIFQLYWGTSVLLVEKTVVHWENNFWQILSHNVV